MLFFGCDLTDRSIVSVTNMGSGLRAIAPWADTFRGDPEKDGYNEAYVQPLIVLFEGKDASWVIEGRDEKVGPANVLVRGAYGLLPGSVVDVGDNRGVIRVNGKEVSSTLIVGAKRPYPTPEFDADISAFAGKHVVIEFICDGFPHLWAMARWIEPRIVVEQ